MSLDDAFERCIAWLHGAALDDARWPAASAAVDKACGTGGNALTVGEGPADGDRIHFARYLSRGECRQDLAREYFDVHYPHDARPDAGGEPDGGTNSSGFSPRLGMRDPWRRHTLGPRGMPPAHECSGGRHYPCGSGFANKEERRRESAVRTGLRPGGGLRCGIDVSNSRHCKFQLAPGDRVPT